MLKKICLFHIMKGGKNSKGGILKIIISLKQKKVTKIQTVRITMTVLRLFEC